MTGVGFDPDGLSDEQQKYPARPLQKSRWSLTATTDPGNGPTLLKMYYHHCGCCNI